MNGEKLILFHHTNKYIKKTKKQKWVGNLALISFSFDAFASLNSIIIKILSWWHERNEWKINKGQHMFLYSSWLNWIAKNKLKLKIWK